MLDSVICNECETHIDVATNENPDNRLPCPNCGSTARNIKRSIKDTIHVTDSLKSTPVAMLLQSVIILGDKNKEGKLVLAVCIPWFDIIELLKKDPDAAYKIPHEKWEEIVAGAYSKAGFDEVTLTPRSGDYGRDVIAIKKGIGSIRVIDQVKAFKPGKLVKANDVRALMGILQGDKASKGFLTTTSDFAPKIKSDPLITPFIPRQLELINGVNLLRRLEELANNR